MFPCGSAVLQPSLIPSSHWCRTQCCTKVCLQLSCHLFWVLSSVSQRFFDYGPIFSLHCHFFPPLPGLAYTVAYLCPGASLTLWWFLWPHAFSQLFRSCCTLLHKGWQPSFFDSFLESETPWSGSHAVLKEENKSMIFEPIQMLKCMQLLW